MLVDAPKIICEKPPVYDRIREAGMNFNPSTTIFTYGNAIYNPANIDVSPDLFAHEHTHIRQQAATNGGPDGWWDRYLQDPLFRVQEEAEAYGVQYRYLCGKKNGRQAQIRLLALLAGILSGPTYGHAVSFKDAVRMIDSVKNSTI